MMYFLAKSSFCLFPIGTERNKFDENCNQAFYTKEARWAEEVDQKATKARAHTWLCHGGALGPSGSPQPLLSRVIHLIWIVGLQYSKLFSTVLGLTNPCKECLWCKTLQKSPLPGRMS
jgi:hypothetical protein